MLVFIFTRYQNNICYPSNFSTGSLSKSQPLICYRGEYVTVTVRIMNSSGDPLTGVITYFDDLTNNLSIGGEYTNSSGYAVLNWGIAQNCPLGLTTIKASCPSRPDAIPVYTDLLIKARTTFVNLTYQMSAYSGEYLVVEADLKDNIYNSISNQQVQLCDYQNNNLTESTTDAFGHCKLSWMIPPGTAIGQLSFYLEFGGTQLYGSTESEFNVSIISPSIEIVSIALNATRVEPNTPILVNIELNYSDPLVLVFINDSFPLENAAGNNWTGTINAPLISGKYALNVLVFYNGTQCINDSSTYYTVEKETSGFSALTLLPFLSEGDSLTSKIAILTPVSALSIISAVMAWKKRNRQPSFSRDYTVDAGSNSS